MECSRVHCVHDASHGLNGWNILLTVACKSACSLELGILCIITLISFTRCLVFDVSCQVKFWNLLGISKGMTPITKSAVDLSFHPSQKSLNAKLSLMDFSQK